MRILLVEDNVSLANLVERSLKRSYVVDVARNLEKARYFLDTKDYDLLILDLSLPDGSGQDLCKYLQENDLFLPIIFVSAETDAERKIFCLQNGNDYLTKPFNMLELETRIKLVLKKDSATKESILKHQDLNLNTSTHEVFINKEEVKLNRKEFLLLELFLKHQTKILSKHVLAEKVWGDEMALFNNTIETTITNLRRKLGKKLIRAVKGVGYTLSV